MAKLEMKSDLVFVGIGLLAAIIALIAFTAIQPAEDQPGKTPDDGKAIANFKEIPHFKNYAELARAFESQAKGRGGYYAENIGIMPMSLPLAQSASKSVVSESIDSSTGASSGYSKTNIQVEGVDEADIVKSDGKYIYAIARNKLIIVDAFPIESAKIVSELDLNNVYPIEMFVLENKLLLFGTKNITFDYQIQTAGAAGGSAGKIGSGIMAERMPYYGGSAVSIILFDISDRANPKQEKELVFEGNYKTSRLIGKNAFVVINSWPHYYYPMAEENAEEKQVEKSIIPVMIENEKEKPIADAIEIGYLPPITATGFITIASLNLDSGELKKEVVAANAETVFASQSSIYLASTYYENRIVPIATPIMPTAQNIPTEQTIVFKFGLSEGKIGFVGKGIIPGHVLNQFSMDEFEGKFRIAATVGQVSRMNSQTSNNLYVLDEKMETIGKLEGLAPGEKIYSARFMGKKAYMVTFKKTDPLFVIDVSNPANPIVLGKLKIPGYSDYLHPIDETHIIGVGKEAIESTYGDFAWYQGMKIAIFDATDVSNPIELHKITIGDRGTDSFALQDHKAFLYDKEKELLVLPIQLSLISEEQKKQVQEDQRNSPLYGEPVFQGAFVWKVTLEKGFEEKGRITHVSKEEELKRGYYFGNDSQIRRALFIDNALYTLSERLLKANDLGSLQELKEFKFQETKNNDYSANEP